MTRSRYKIFNTAYPYFLTATIVEWLPLFSNPSIVQIIFDSFEFMQKHDRLIIYAHVIMENHLHLIASSPDLSKEIGDFKSYTARQIIDYYKVNNGFILESLAKAKKFFKIDRDYQFWQEGSHPKQIQDRRMMRQKIEYIHNNPVRRGYVDEPQHWRYSSARNYMNGGGLISICKEW